jgi:predicted Zn finger-like uncharacterized protein
MSLATRCSACGTVFRVVQDQLKVSEGWVRCGRCNEVFNALEGLFDLDRDSSPEAWAPTVPDPGNFDPPQPHESLGAAFSDGITEDPADPALVDRIDAHLFGPRRTVTHRKPLAHVAERDQLEFADAQLDSHPLSDSPLVEPEFSDYLANSSPAPLESELADPANPPEFVQRAERAARWRRPGVRVALGLVGLLLLVGLAGQAAHHQRDAIAARWPELRPTLDQWCEQVGCRIEALRRIEDISVESTALTRVASPTDAFRLAVALRNRSALPLALPSVDLSLTDAEGQLVARRALGPADFRVSTAPIAPGGEAALQLTLSAGSPRVSGYTVEIFYP